MMILNNEHDVDMSVVQNYYKSSRNVDCDKEAYVSPRPITLSSIYEFFIDLLIFKLIYLLFILLVSIHPMPYPLVCIHGRDVPCRAWRENWVMRLLLRRLTGHCLCWWRCLYRPLLDTTWLACVAACGEVVSMQDAMYYSIET
jgi:hypothetical protein